MSVIQPKRLIPFIAIIISIVFLAFTAFNYFLGGQNVTGKVSSLLRKSLKANGLTIDIKRIKWSSLNNIVASGVILKDLKDDTILFTAARINIHLNLFALIKNHLHPESTLQEIQLVKPQFTLKRYQDKTFNFSKYFPGRKRPLQFQMKLKIRDGLIRIEDYQYGSYILNRVVGQIDMKKYPFIQWRLKGRSNFNKGMNWNSQGKLRADQSAGNGEFQTNQISLTKLLPFIPYQIPFKLRSGLAQLMFKFAWNKKAIWLEQGNADVSNAVAVTPKFENPIYIRKLETSFSPQKIIVKKIRLTHEKSTLTASGEINTDTNQIKAMVGARQLKIEDISKFIKTTGKISCEGLVNLQLEISGSFAEPVMDGELFVNNSRLFIGGQKTIERISGRLTIRRNNLVVEHFEGTWNNSLIGIYGNIDNLLKPKMNLRAYGFGLSLQPEEIARLSSYGLKTQGDINFLGEISGEPLDPKITGEIAFDQVIYKEIPINNLKVKLAWDSTTKNLKILKVNAQVWEGQLDAKGEIAINTDRVTWQVSGNLSELNIGTTPYGSKIGVNGKVAADLIFKGGWKTGTPFQVGSIFGIFKGDNLRYKDLTMEETNGIFSFVDGTLSIDTLQARIGNGTVFGNLSWAPSMVQINLNAENLNIQQLVPDRKKYPLNGIFNGNLVFEGPPVDIKGKISGVFSEVSWDSKPIGAFRGVLDYRNQVLTVADSHLTTESGDFTIGGNINFTNSPSLSINVNSNENIRLAGFLPWIPLKQPFKLNGDADLKLEITGELSNPSFHGEANLYSPEIGPLSMDKGHIIIDGNIKELVLTDFFLSRDNSEVRINGSINHEKLDLKLHGSSINLDTMQLQANGKNLTGIINFVGQITGPLTNPTLNSEVSGENLSFGNFTFQQMEGQIRWDSKTIDISNATLTQGDSRIDFYGRINPTAPVQLNLEIKGRSINLKDIFNNYSVLPGSMDLDGKVSGFMKVNGKLNNPDVEITGNLSEGLINKIPISGDFDLAYKSSKVIIKQFLLTQEIGNLSAKGVWEPGKLLNLEVGLQDFSLGIINSFVDPAYQFTGKINSSILLQWTNVGINGGYKIEVNDFGLNKSQLGVLKLNGNFYNQGLLISEGDITRKGINLTMKGYLPWPSKLLQWLKFPVIPNPNSQSIDLSFLFNNFPADFVSAFIPNVIATNGTINGEVALQGSLVAPKINGNLECNGVNLNIQGLPYPVDGLHASMLFEGYRVEIQNGKGNYGKGKFNLNGSIDYHNLKFAGFNLGIIGSNLYYKNHYFDGYGDLNLKLNGNLTDNIISGDLKIHDCRIGILGLVPNKNEKPPAWNPALAINLKTGRNVRYRQIGMADIDVKGSVQIKGRILKPELEGEAESKKGILTFYGQTFRVTNGKATFTYSEGFNPYIEVDSNLKTPQAVVFLTIKGQVGGNISINLTSQPFLSQSELFSMLNWSDLSGDKPFTVNGALLGNAGFVTDSLFGDVFFELRSALNLDMLYLEPNYQQNDLRLNVGRYITNEFFLSYSRSFSDLPKEKWGLDYQLTPQLSLGGSFSILEGTSWRLVYRFSF